MSVDLLCITLDKTIYCLIAGAHVNLEGIHAGYSMSAKLTGGAWIISLYDANENLLGSAMGNDERHMSKHIEYLITKHIGEVS